MRSIQGDFYCSLVAVYYITLCCTFSATVTYTDGDVSDQHNRQLTFFKLTNSLAAKLQELFIQYAGHILKAASDFLNESLNGQSFVYFLCSIHSFVHFGYLLVTYYDIYFFCVFHDSLLFLFLLFYNLLCCSFFYYNSLHCSFFCL